MFNSFEAIFNKKIYFGALIFFFYSCKTTQVSLSKRTLTKLPINDSYKATYQDERVKFLILHYTAGNFSRAIDILHKGIPTHQVSAHYLIPDKRKELFLLVKEDKRAWHAGISNWGNRTNLNDSSIGVEIVNFGYQDTLEGRKWYVFNEYQIRMIIALSKDIISRYNIKPNFVLGHSDIAPGRKIDPGPLFPWERLAENAIGAWYDKGEVEKISQDLKEKTIDVGDLQKSLKTYGYKIEETGKLDKQTKEVLIAFQMHFRPSDHSGKIDAQTVAILYDLIERYIK